VAAEGWTIPHREGRNEVYTRSDSSFLETAAPTRHIEGKLGEDSSQKAMMTSDSESAVHMATDDPQQRCMIQRIDSEKNKVGLESLEHRKIEPQSCRLSEPSVCEFSSCHSMSLNVTCWPKCRQLNSHYLGCLESHERCVRGQLCSVLLSPPSSIWTYPWTSCQGERACPHHSYSPRQRPMSFWRERMSWQRCSHREKLY
jgi:hypothetical protein